MKNTISFCTVIFLLLMNATAFGQQATISQQLPISTVMDVLPDEMKHLVGDVMQAIEKDLAELSQNLPMEAGDFPEGSLEVEISLEIVYTSGIAPVTRPESIYPVAFVGNRGNGIFSYAAPVNKQNFTSANTQSIVYVANQPDWMELCQKGWNLDGTKYSPTSTVGDWQFRIGRDEM
ncbi:MAG: hypothetical protein AB8G22_13130 [Saprospiraceae bacterium]